jgi:hypothetical protein
MSWIQYHSESERLASLAEIELRNGNVPFAHSLYTRAAEEENKAIDFIDQAKTRTLAITAVSIASLWYKAKNHHMAEQTAYRFLSVPNLQGFAIEQLRSLLQSIWNENAMERAGVKFIPGQVLVAVRGGEVVRGGAPLELIIEKVQTVQSYFYRTVEFIQKLPHRKKGPPDKGIQAMCRPWLFQAVPSSYQFAIAIQEPGQLSLPGFEDPKPTTIEIASHFLSILRASLEDPEGELLDIVPDKDYQNTFIKLTRNIVPTGKSYEEMVVRAADGTRPISLIPAFREDLNKNLRSRRRGSLGEDNIQEQTFQGILRALDIERDWLELIVNDKHIKIIKIGDAVDDVIGPMVNRPVIVKAINKKNHFEFLDIEPDE